MPPPPDTITSRLLAAQVDVQAHVDRDSRWIETLFGVFMAAFFYWQTGSQLAWAWLGLRGLAHLTGDQVSRRYFADHAHAEQPARWMRRFTAFSALESTVWAAAAWMLPPAGDAVLHALLAIVIIIAGSAAIYATQAWPVVVAWILPMSLGLIAALLWQGGPAALFMAACAVMNLGLVLHFGRMQQQLMAQALVARFEKEDLAERLVEQAQVARRANEAKTRFLAAASHDLRQPMHAITLFGSVLEKGLQHHPMHVNATRLMHAVDALGSSLGSMLDVSRLDAGAIAPVVVATPINPILRRLSQTFAAVADERGLQLRLRATPLWVRTDPELLRRMLANLVENALKYSRAGGVLVVARARGDTVWIEVRDTGIGIDPIHQQAVFQEFFQIDNPGRDRSRGLGMGLSIVQRLGRLLGHELQLRSHPGRGTCFRIIAPAAMPQPEATVTDGTHGDKAGRAAEPPLRLPRHVLLVDDEDDIANAMQAMMHAHGIRLERSANAAQAVALCAQAQAHGDPVEALICDLRLAEGADGLALALRLREQYASAHGALPTLMVTGETAPEPIQRVRASGLPVLFKPVAAATLLQTLARLAAPPGTPPEPATAQPGVFGRA